MSEWVIQDASWIYHFPAENLRAVSYQPQVEAHTPGGGIWCLHTLPAFSTSDCPLPSDTETPDLLRVAFHTHCACFPHTPLPCLCFCSPLRPDASTFSSGWGQNGVMSSREPSVNPGAITHPLFVLLWVPEFGSITVVTSVILVFVTKWWVSPG